MAKPDMRVSERDILALLARWSFTLSNILDGATAGQTAKLVDPYVGSKDYRGPWRVMPEVYKEKLFKYDAMGLSVSAHCAGDAAARLVLDSVEELRKKPGNNAKKTAPLHSPYRPAETGRYPPSC